MGAIEHFHQSIPALPFPLTGSEVKIETPDEFVGAIEALEVVSRVPRCFTEPWQEKARPVIARILQEYDVAPQRTAELAGVLVEYRPAVNLIQNAGVYSRALTADELPLQESAQLRRDWATHDGAQILY